MTEKGDILFRYSNSDEIILQNLGIQLRQMRLNRNLTQKQLSGLSGISRSAIGNQ
jgi:DNA-binding XRE family transcriptional regulator